MEHFNGFYLGENTMSWQNVRSFIGKRHPGCQVPVPRARCFTGWREQ